MSKKFTPRQPLSHWTKKLDLQPHPEGGFYREFYRSSHTVINQNNKERSVCTDIYYVLRDVDVSHFHQIQSDEMWHYYDGDLTLRIYGIEPVSGEMHTWDLGPEGELTALVPAKYWFAVVPLLDGQDKPAPQVSEESKTDASSEESQSFALCGCTVAPGFDFEDFQMANRANLVKAFSEHEEIINRLTMEDKTEES